MSRSITRLLAVGAIAALCLAGCGGSEPPAIAIHLVDHYSPEALQDEFIGRSPQRDNLAERTHFLRDVFDQRSNVSAFGAGHGELKL